MQTVQCLPECCPTPRGDPACPLFSCATQVIDAELEAVHVRLRTMAGEMAAKADTVTVTKAVDTLDDSVQRCVRGSRGRRGEGE